MKMSKAKELAMEIRVHGEDKALEALSKRYTGAEILKAVELARK